MVPMAVRLCLMIAAAALLLSCARHARIERPMTWSEESQFAGTPLPEGEKLLVLRFAADPDQGLTLDPDPALLVRLARLGNPVNVTFDCWRQLGGAFGYNILAIGDEPYVPVYTSGPSRAGAFSRGPSRPNPLESAFPR
jgi:hypothetical protein